MNTKQIRQQIKDSFVEPVNLQRGIISTPLDDKTGLCCHLASGKHSVGSELPHKVKEGEYPCRCVVVYPKHDKPKGEPKMTIQDCRMIIDIPENELCSMWDKAFDTKDHNTCDEIDEELERRSQEDFFDTRKEVIENETDQSNRSS